MHLSNSAFTFSHDRVYPLAPIPDDWTFFIKDQNKDASSYFSLIDQEIAKTPKDSVFVVVLHPWVLAIDESRVDALEDFVSQHKKDIKSIDQINKISTN